MKKGLTKTMFKMAGLCILGVLTFMMQPVSAQAEKTEILIGAHLPLSGIMGAVGVEQKWAYDKAVEDINKTGGIFVKDLGKKLPVRLIVMDDESDPATAAMAVERLIRQDKVDLLLGGNGGALGVIPGMTTAEKYKRYYHGTVIWKPDFLANNFKWCTMYFVEIPQIGALPFEVWNTLPEDQRPKRIAIFMEDNTDGEQMTAGLKALAEKYGYKIVLTETLPVGGTDFSGQIMKAKSAGVDAILSMTTLNDAIALVSQMKAMKLNVKFFQGWKGHWSMAFYETLGKSTENIMCDGFWSMDYPFAGAKDLGERYKKEQGGYSVSAGAYYALCQSLWQAIEKAGTLDGAKIRQAVIDNQFDTVNGEVDYDEKGVAIFPMADFQWRDGKQTVVYPAELSKTKVEPMTP